MNVMLIFEGVLEASGDVRTIPHWVSNQYMECATEKTIGRILTECVNNDSCKRSKCQTVAYDACHWKEWWGISPVLLSIELVIGKYCGKVI
jgi:hypothetical protein